MLVQPARLQNVRMTHPRLLQDLHVFFFDLFGTLTRFWPPREELQATATCDLGLHITRQGIAEGCALADALMALANAAPLRLLQTWPHKPHEPPN